MKSKLIASLLITVLFITGCKQEKEPISVIGVTLTENTLTITEGETSMLQAIVQPENADNKTVFWTSDTPSVVSVNSGNIKAHKTGKAIITVTTEDGNKSASCTVVVDARVYPVEKIELNESSLELMEGETVTLVASITPSNATNKNIIWSSDNEDVASVEDGKVTAIKEGTAIITAKTEDGNKTANCQINVSHDPLTDPIIFSDDLVKEMCIEAFDSNKDGELSYHEAAAVTDLAQMNIKSKEFESFNELKYFVNITEIPDNFFAECNLKTITLPEKLTSIGQDAFYGCRYLTSVNLPNGLLNINSDAFCNCLSLTNVILPESLTSIGSYAFACCHGITSIIIPDSVTNIEIGAFTACINLAEIELPNNLTTIEDGMFEGCTSLKSINIPDSISSIGNSAFFNCSSLSSITIPDSVTSIGNWAFYDCNNLTSITIGKNVSTIGELALFGRHGELTINSKIIETDYADNTYYSSNISHFLYGTAFSKIIIGDNVSKIGNNMFRWYDSLTEITLGKNLTEIGDSAFDSCDNLTNITLPDGLTVIGTSAFSNCLGLTSIVIPDNVISIGNSAFSQCSNVETLILGKHLTSIGDHAFTLCRGLTDLTFPDGLVSIGNYTFAGCNNLTNIIIPDSVESIGSYAFYD